jgi:hypothetical protein
MPRVVTPKRNAEAILHERRVSVELLFNHFDPIGVNVSRLCSLADESRIELHVEHICKWSLVLVRAPSVHGPNERDLGPLIHYFFTLVTFLGSNDISTLDELGAGKLRPYSP